jgi:NTP pyrophosphatase (non-canonical NTP hydrolase)
MRTIQEWCNYCNAVAIQHGWDFEEREIPEKIALMHSELSEALEEYRKRNMKMYYLPDSPKPEGFAVELADLLIRVFHMAGRLQLDLEPILEEKMSYNKTRPYRHGGLEA